MQNKPRIQPEGVKRPIISYKDLLAIPPYSELTFLTVGVQERQRVAATIRYAMKNYPREDGLAYAVKSKDYPYEKEGKIVTIKTVPRHDKKRSKNDSE